MFPSLDSIVHKFRKLGRRQQRRYGPNLRFRDHVHVRVVDSGGFQKSEDYGHNLITNAGLNDVLNAYIRGTTQTTAWYMGLVDNAGYSSFAAADTPVSHGGWAENQFFSQTTRPQWSPGASSGQSITNTSSVNFSITATVAIRGIFISSASALGATTGTLFSEAAFSGSTQSCNSGDTLQATYTLSLASN